jgi:hypothetical protein
MLARCILFAVVAYYSSSGALADPLKIGPLDRVIRINTVEVPFVATGILDLNTARGDFNAVGELTITSDLAKFRDEATSILKTLLPQDFQLSDRVLTIEELSSLEILPHDYEVDISATVIASIGSSWFEKKKEVALKINAIPRVISGKRLSWKILRQPEIDLPALWWAAMEINGRHPNQIAGDAIQKWLDENASFDVPTNYGIRASLQGANFDGNSKIVSLRIKGDAHADPASFTSILRDLTKDLDLNFTARMPKANQHSSN